MRVADPLYPGELAAAELSREFTPAQAREAAAHYLRAADEAEAADSSERT